jgi:hypothetical protein
MQGQLSHLAQAKKCHKKWQAYLDALQIPSNNLFKGSNNADNQPAGLGEHLAIDKVLNVDWDTDAPHFPDPLADELHSQGEYQEGQHDKDDSESAPSPKA